MFTKTFGTYQCVVFIKMVRRTLQVLWNSVNIPQVDRNRIGYLGLLSLGIVWSTHSWYDKNFKYGQVFVLYKWDIIFSIMYSKGTCVK